MCGPTARFLAGNRVAMLTLLFSYQCRLILHTKGWLDGKSLQFGRFHGCFGHTVFAIYPTASKVSPGEQLHSQWGRKGEAIACLKELQALSGR